MLEPASKKSGLAHNNQSRAPPKRFLLTGGSGFIGKAACLAFLSLGNSIKLTLRSTSGTSIPLGCGSMVFEDIRAKTNWSAALKGVDCVIHLAARAHVMTETKADPLAAYREVNVAGTHRLAEQAAASGVRRLVFLSSIGVNGTFTDGPSSFAAQDVPCPTENYAISKWEAEQALWEVSAKTGLEVAVIRSPLVYGPGVKGNMLRLLQWAARGVPLPLGAVNNARSLIGLDNLVDLLIRCVNHPAAAGQTLLVSDGQDLSTPELIRTLAHSMKKPARLLPVPVPLLRAAGSLVGKRAEVDRLVGSLRVDSSHTRALLGWTPPVSVEAGLKKMADWYLQNKNQNS